MLRDRIDKSCSTFILLKTSDSFGERPVPRKTRTPDVFGQQHTLGDVGLEFVSIGLINLHLGHRFLPTEDDKLAFFCRERSITQSVLPTKTYAWKADKTDRLSPKRLYSFVEENSLTTLPASSKN